MVVIVEAMIELVTNFAPSSAASRWVSWRSCRWKQLSSTTIELSTIMPTPMMSPPRETTLKEKPIMFIRMRVVSTETGIELPTMREARQSRKKRKSTIMQRMTAPISVWMTVLIEARICSLESLMTDISTPMLLSLILFIVSMTARETSTVPALCRLVIEIMTVSWPL